MTEVLRQELIIADLRRSAIRPFSIRGEDIPESNCTVQYVGDSSRDRSETKEVLPVWGAFGRSVWGLENRRRRRSTVPEPSAIECTRRNGPIRASTDMHLTRVQTPGECAEKPRIATTEYGDTTTCHSPHTKTYRHHIGQCSKITAPHSGSFGGRTRSPLPPNEGRGARDSMVAIKISAEVRSTAGEPERNEFDGQCVHSRRPLNSRRTRPKSYVECRIAARRRANRSVDSMVAVATTPNAV